MDSAQLGVWPIIRSFMTYYITLRSHSRTLDGGNVNFGEKDHAPFGFRILTNYHLHKIVAVLRGSSQCIFRIVVLWCCTSEYHGGAVVDVNVN